MSYTGQETSRQRTRLALKLITDSHDGLTYTDLREQHLHGTPAILIKLGMIHRRHDSVRGWVYHANKHPAVR